MSSQVYIVKLKRRPTTDVSYDLDLCPLISDYAFSANTDIKILKHYFLKILKHYFVSSLC